MRKLKNIVILLFVFFVFMGCVKQTQAPDSINIGTLKGSSSIGMAELIKNNKTINNVNCEYEIFASPDILLPKLIKGEIDAGILPINVAGKIYNATNGKIKLAAVVGSGMLKLISTDENLVSLEQLKGKTLNVAGVGSTPEYMIKYLLRKSEISVGTGSESVNLSYNFGPSEISAALLSGKINNAIVPEPFATMILSNENFYSKINLQELYTNYSDMEEYPMTAFVVCSDFAEKYPVLLEKILIKYKNSINFANNNPIQCGKYVEELGLGLKSQIVAKSIPNSNFKFSFASDYIKEIEYFLSFLFYFAPESLGNEIPDENFYLNIHK